MPSNSSGHPDSTGRALRFIRAQELSDTADWLERMVQSTDTSGYANAGRDIIGQLRRRAERIAGELDPDND